MPKQAEQARSIDETHATARATSVIEDKRPAAQAHAQLREMTERGRRALQFQAQQRAVSRDVLAEPQAHRVMPGGQRVVQRLVFIGASTRPLGSTAPQVGEVAQIAQAVAPAQAAQIVATFRAWIRDPSSRRFADARAAVAAILNTLGGVTPPTPPSEEPAARRSGDSGEPREPISTSQPDPRGQIVPSHVTTQDEPPGDPGRIDHDDEVVATDLVPQGNEREPVLPDRSTAESSSQPAPDLASQIRPEASTRVGFEIELGEVYRFPESARPTLERLLNRTLAEYVVVEPSARRGEPPRPRALLEVLLDDIKPIVPGQEGDRVTAQVEFRTPPFAFAALNTTLASQLRGAISRFPTSMFTSGSPSTTNDWRPTALLRQHARQLTEGAPDHGRFAISATSALAQHATISIELGAFGRLGGDQQGQLFPAGRGAANKQQLVERLARLTGGGGRLDASTGGRNRAGSTVKTPVESILAADSELRAPQGTDEPGSVTVDGSTGHPYAPIDEAVRQIQAEGRFPSLQGEGGQGFRAVAEKLQPPLRDRVSGELRVLVEHRNGSLVRAVNEALRGRPEALRPITAAAGEMDRQRVPLTRPQSSGTSSRESPATASTVSTTASRVQPEAVQGARPVIAAPPGPMNVLQLIQHYGPGVLWARQGDTFSAEFLQFRDQQATALQTLVQHGLAQAEATAIGADLTLEVGNAGAAALAPHPPAALQEQIFDAVDDVWGRDLWALLRYFNGG
ncbi:hypothetical protein [Pandoraea norimbergensis]